MRAIVAAAIAVLAIAFAVVQLASYALDARAAAPGTLPTRIPPAFGLAVYQLLDRIAPAPYVESTLATQALVRGDASTARRYALRLPASPARDELLARSARAGGDSALALEYYLAAPDVDAVSQAVRAMLPRDPVGAYTLEQALEVRLLLLQTHPDAVAETYFRMGEIADVLRRRRLAMQNFQTAVDLAPLSDKYLIAAGNQAALLGNVARAQALFARAVDVDPGSADAVAGLGVMTLRRGDRTAALADFARARRLDPHAGMVRALARALRERP